MSSLPGVYAVQPPQSVIEESPAGNTEPGSLKKSSIVDTPEYKMLLQNYPNLPELLSSIATATDPPAADNPSRSRKPWNRDIGMDNGVSALRKAKIAPGDDREAIREFSALVKLFRERNALEMGMDVKARKAREDAKIIKGLMEEEDGS
ncbi:hypothetical protein F4778DRAFT_782888 [Xylariomycetidae sp. FL2044]|nr:hypothetical protein F4778DRAFT_782888 [Xylariomycetidae sp. FL2044]